MPDNDFHGRMLVIELTLKNIQQDQKYAREERDQFFRDARASNERINAHLSKQDKMLWMLFGGIVVINAAPNFWQLIHK